MLVKDNQTFTLDGVEIKAIATAGHTMGHMSYLVDGRYLFVGDTLLLGEDGGYAFMDFWNVNSPENMRSLDKLLAIATENQVELVITSHSAFSDDIEFAFRHRKTMPDWKKKGFIFRKDAPFNPYKD